MEEIKEVEEPDMKQRVEALAQRFIDRHIQQIGAALDEDDEVDTYLVHPSFALCTAFMYIYSEQSDFEDGYAHYLQMCDNVSRVARQNGDVQSTFVGIGREEVENNPIEIGSGESDTVWGDFVNAFGTRAPINLAYLGDDPSEDPSSDDDNPPELI